MKNFTMVICLLLITAVTSGQTVRSPEHRRSVNYYANIHRNTNNDNNTSVRNFREGRVVAYHYPAPPKTKEYRRIYQPYPIPVSFGFYWTPESRYEYIRLYPEIAFHRYPIGRRIDNVSAYDAMHFRGELANVYGRVYEVYYSRYCDEYILYFGAYFPYHDFTVVVPGTVARCHSPWPERYFAKENLIVTGLITSNKGTPEIVIKAEGQIRHY